MGILRREELLERLSNILNSVKTHDFQLVELEPHAKDGGVFVHFKYNASETDNAVENIQNSIREEVSKHGGIPSWSGWCKGDVWVVKGTPWKEVGGSPHFGEMTR